MTAPQGSLLNKWWTAQLALVQYDLSSGAHLLFSRLLYHHNSKTGLCCPGEKLLAASLNCTTRTVRNALRELERVGLVKTRKGPESPPRNYYELTLFTGSTEEYRLAEKKCLQRRKKASGKSENEPEKYRQRKRSVQSRAQDARGSTATKEKSLAKVRGDFERILVEKMGGGDVGWGYVMELDGATIDEAIRQTDGSTKTLSELADQFLLGVVAGSSGED